MERNNRKINDQQYVWNSMNLLPPELEFYETTKKIHGIVREAIVGEFRTNKCRDLLFREMVLLSQFVNERKNKYRGDKGFRSIRKIKKVVERIYLVDLKSAVTVIEANLNDTFVPSKQIGQWLCIKFQSNALLLYLLLEYCMNAAFRLQQRVKIGHNWIEVIVTLSMISRICTLSRFLLNTCLKSYGKFLPVLNNLKSSEAEADWLSPEYIFPEDLQEWIEQSRAYGTLFTSDEIKSAKDNHSDSKGDGNLNSKKTPKIFRLISNIRTAEDLKSFFLKENARRRKKNRNKCVSKQLDNLQWHMLRKQTCKWLKNLRKHEDEAEVRISRIKKELRKWFL